MKAEDEEQIFREKAGTILPSREIWVSLLAKCSKSKAREVLSEKVLGQAQSRPGRFVVKVRHP